MEMLSPASSPKTAHAIPWGSRTSELRLTCSLYTIARLEKVGEAHQLHTFFLSPL